MILGFCKNPMSQYWDGIDIQLVALFLLFEQVDSQF
jgi:hypothetical protein